MTSFHLDLSAHELRRRAAVLDATPDWDPAAALADETRAHEMLYSGLDAHQQAVLAQLRASWSDPLMIDADALAGRRAWLACVRCDDGTACSRCRDNRTCEDHWRYLLSAEGRRLFVQCPACRHRWWHDTGFGSGDRTERTTPPWPSRRNAA